MQALLSQFARNSKKSKTLDEAINTTVDVNDESNDEGDDKGDDESDTKSSASQQDDEELNECEVLVIEDNALAEAKAVEDDEVEEAASAKWQFSCKFCKFLQPRQPLATI